MSRFFSEKYEDLEAYTPGEQPQDRNYIKLNTNESPFPVDHCAIRRASQASKRLNLYNDPECEILSQKLAEYYGVSRRQVLATNGSDEGLNFAFMAFCDEKSPAIFPDITYGFYQVFAQINHVPCRKIPLKEDFTVDIRDYQANDSTIFLANPNANTGIALSAEEIEEILKANPDHVVVIDEAYVDFGADSVVPLVDSYDNLLVTQTFSKAWSMAGARLGVCIGSEELINDLNTIKYSTNPYNVNTMTQAAGIGALERTPQIRERCRIVRSTREEIKSKLTDLGFSMTDSSANFILVRHPDIGGEQLYEKLKARGILVRHFGSPRINDYIRITIGSMEQMQILLQEIRDILREE